MSDRINRLRSDEGAVAIVMALTFALVLFAVAALVVDVGIVESGRRQMQTSADAAALAGARSLLAGRAEAENVARAYAAANGVDPARVTFPYPGEPPTQITAAVDADTSLAFAQNAGRTSQGVSAAATGMMGSPSTYGKGVMPFGIMARETTAPPYGMTFGEVVTLETSTSGSSSGNFHVVDFSKNALHLDADGNPVNPLSDDPNAKSVIDGGGSDYPLSIGDGIQTEPGYSFGPYLNAFNHYLGYSEVKPAPKDPTEPKWEGGDSHTPADLVLDPVTGAYSIPSDPGCPRIITCPVIIVAGAVPPDCYDWGDLNGTKQVLVINFINVFVEGYVDVDTGVITGRFIQVVDPSAMGHGSYTSWAGVTYWLEN